MKTYIWSLLIVLYIFPVMSLYAQRDKPLRVEFSSFGRNNDYSVLLADDKGLIVLRDDGKNQDNQNVWKLFGYSTKMKQKWKSTIMVNNDFVLSRKFYNDNYANLLFLDSQNKESVIKQYRIEMSNGKTDSVSYSVDGKLNIKDFRVVDNQSFILGLDIKGFKNFLSSIFSSSEDEGKRMKLIHYEWNTGEMKLISDSFDTGMRPKSLDIFEHGKTVDVYTARDVSDSRDDIWMYSFSYSGVFQKKYKFSPVKGKFVVELAVTSYGKNRHIAATMSSLRDRYDRYEDYTDGIYLSVFKNGEEAVSRFYKLSNLNSFYAKADPDMFRFFPGRKKVTGSVGYQIKMHPKIKGNSDEMILLAEAYYPEYHTEWYYDAYGVARTRYIFDGYRFTHALAIAFNDKAEITWDESMKISGIRSYSRRKRVDIISDGSIAGIAYNLDNELHFQLVVDGQAEERAQAVTLPLMFSNDHLKKSHESRINYWYNNFLLASGYQKIDNRDKGNRRVFYIYKISFQ